MIGGRQFDQMGHALVIGVIGVVVYLAYVENLVLGPVVTFASIVATDRDGIEKTSMDNGEKFWLRTEFERRRECPSTWKVMAVRDGEGHQISVQRSTSIRPRAGSLSLPKAFPLIPPDSLGIFHLELEGVHRCNPWFETVERHRGGRWVDGEFLLQEFEVK